MGRGYTEAVHGSTPLDEGGRWRRRAKRFSSSQLRPPPRGRGWLTGPLSVKYKRLTDQQFKDAFVAMRVGWGLRGSELIEENQCPLCGQLLAAEEVLWHPVSCSTLNRAHRHYVVNEAMSKAIPACTARGIQTRKEVLAAEVLTRKSGEFPRFPQPA